MRLHTEEELVGSLHTLQHTQVSDLLSCGEPLSAISAQPGHSGTNVTARIYSLLSTPITGSRQIQKKKKLGRFCRINSQAVGGALRQHNGRVYDESDGAAALHSLRRSCEGRNGVGQ